MPTVIYPNGKTISLHAANKCGISTVQSYLGYPIWGDLRGRNGKRELKQKGLWIGERDINEAYPTLNVDHSACVIRHPVSRMTSIYIDRVTNKSRENCFKEIKNWDNFVQNFPLWREKYKDIRIHSNEQSSILMDLKYYDKVFTTSQLGKEVREWLGNLTDCVIPEARGKFSHGKTEEIEVTYHQEKLIREYFKNDFIVYKNYFQ